MYGDHSHLYPNLSSLLFQSKLILNISAMMTILLVVAGLAFFLLFAKSTDIFDKI